MIRGRIRREKNTHTLCLSGLSPSENQYTSAKNTVVNAWCALMERVYYHYPSGNPADAARPYIPVPGWCFQGLHSFTLAMRELSPSSTPVALRVYPERYYTGRRLRVYQRARDLIEVRGSENKDAELISFIKVEKLAYGTKRIVPRLIQPRKPVYNVCVGRFLRPIEPVIYAMIADLFSCGRPRRVVCAKGLNCFELGDLISENWNEFLTPVAVGIDAHRFDQHVCKEMLKWEHSIYTMFFHGADRLELSRLLRKQLENRGRIFCDDGEIHYSVSGSRMTGDMNTAVGNCLICCAIIYAWLLPRGLLPLVRIVDNGDDMIIITDERHRRLVMDGLAAWFHDFGFEIKVEAPVWIKEKVVFCQCQPVFDGERWRMVRSIPTSLCKDSVILQSGADANQQDLYIQGVGVAGLALASGLPVIQEFYSAMIRPSFDSALPKRKPGTVLEVGNLNPLGLAETGFYHLAKGCESRWRPVTWQARASFGLAFDMSPAVQLELETYYKSLRKQLSRRVQALEFVPL